MSTNPKLSPSVSVVPLGNGIIEFFMTNTRRQVRLKTQDDAILKIVNGLDGSKTAEEIAHAQGYTPSSVKSLLAYLSQHGILDNAEPKEDFESYDDFRRVISFLQDYSTSHEHLIQMWKRLRDSRVVVVGLGGVGSWVACTLIQTGVRHIVLMDPDTVDLSNLHRQFGYRKIDLGRPKVDALSERLRLYRGDLDVTSICRPLDEHALEDALGDERIDLVVNCADKPTVDQTSTWVGEFCMPRGIPHIVGGGYNLHLSLIGQTVIPGKTACVRCFEKQLEVDNQIDGTRVKKLQVANRKVGSIGPLCALNASMVSMEAIKVLTGCTEPANVNRRGEFDITTMDVSYRRFDKLPDCEWCGPHGKYYSG
ncbi:MAG: ThiF family adenylyltransferase [Olsenella sp.]|nr:ThiF family adenylyltransferase [Olsenella sp.]